MLAINLATMHQVAINFRFYLGEEAFSLIGFFGVDDLFLRGGEPCFVFFLSFCFLGLAVYLLFCGNIFMCIYQTKIKI